jgi:hypothetical protein
MNSPRGRWVDYCSIGRESWKMREREKERKGVLTITLASLCEIHRTEQNRTTSQKEKEK